jgi:hypothetical protein
MAFVFAAVPLECVTVVYVCATPSPSHPNLWHLSSSLCLFLFVQAETKVPNKHTRSMSVDQIDTRNKSAVFQFVDDIRSIFFNMPSLKEGEEGEEDEENESRSQRSSVELLKEGLDLMGGVSEDEDDN